MSATNKNRSLPRKKKGHRSARTKYNRAFSIDVDALTSDLLACEGETVEGTADAFKWQYLRQEILSKFPREGVPASERRDNAILKMLESEKSCQDINLFGYKASVSVNLDAVIFFARRIVSNVLGEFEYSIFEKSTFSGGATTSRRRERGHPYFKYCGRKDRLDVTPKAERYAAALISLTPLWAASGAWCSLRTIAGNSVTTVPKKTEIDRAIAKEPDMNVCLQKAVGTHIRARLKRHGINLDDQKRNQHLAMVGSKSRQLATIDLSAASDSISDRLVWDLLPPEWYRVLDDLRSHYGFLPGGRLIRWSKFSSMGNGFTFELESLLFYALLRGVIEWRRLSSVDSHGCLHGTVGVYGDDLICHADYAPDVIEALRCVGFATNTDKTFFTGPFRESCGKHYFAGVDVTPFYIRKPIDNVQRCCWFLNSLREWAGTGNHGVLDPRVYQLWLRLRRRYVPAEILGGKDTSDITSCVSPERPRFKVVEVTRSRPLGGVRALLSLWQNEPMQIVSFGYVDYEDQPTEDKTLRELVLLHRRKLRHGSICPDRLHPNLAVPLGLFVLKQNEQWSLPIATFPQEEEARGS